MILSDIQKCIDNKTAIEFFSDKKKSNLLYPQFIGVVGNKLKLYAFNELSFIESYNVEEVLKANITDKVKTFDGKEKAFSKFIHERCQSVREVRVIIEINNIDNMPDNSFHLMRNILSYEAGLNYKWIWSAYAEIGSFLYQWLDELHQQGDYVILGPVCLKAYHSGLKDKAI